MSFEAIYGKEVVDEVFRMRSKGMSMRAIASVVGIGLGSVHRILHRSRACDRGVILSEEG